MEDNECIGLKKLVSFFRDIIEAPKPKRIEYKICKNEKKTTSTVDIKRDYYLLFI